MTLATVRKTKNNAREIAQSMRARGFKTVIRKVKQGYAVYGYWGYLKKVR